MKKFTMLFVCLIMLGVHIANAQQRTITGTVTSSEDGMSLPGVSVAVKGTTVGTITNVDGKYSLDVAGDAQTLVYSFVGMKTKEVQIGSSNVIDVVMEAEVIGVDEVIVTALGISREKKSLGYAVQEVQGDEMNKVKSDNFVTSLSGRVSGVQVKNNTTMGGSTNVIIRGSSSLTQNNQALFVVDGIPISNANTNNTGQTTGRNGYDYGNAASDINPSDIESVSVLKGAAATALYGSRAANGVILITTKKGKKSQGKSFQVNVNSNITLGVFDKSTFPTYQDEYGAGYDPTWYSSTTNPGLDEWDMDGDGTIDGLFAPVYEDASRGERFNSALNVYQWDSFVPESKNYGKAYAWEATKNGAETFFETAVSKTNSIDFNGATDLSTYRFSYTNMDQKGIMPNSSIKRNNYIFNGSYNILDNLKVSTSANYINTQGKGRPSTGYSDNIISSFRQWWAVNVDVQDMKDLYDQTGRNVTWNPKGWDPNFGGPGVGGWDATPNYWDNPYWVRYENYQTDERNRLIGYAQLDWDITDYLSFMGRAAIDTYSELQEERKAVGSVSGEFGVGRNDATSGYSRYERTWTETNMDFMLKFNKRLSETIKVNALIGSNIRRSKMDRVYASTNNGLAVPGLYSLNNSVDPMLPPEERLEEIGVNGFFGSATIDYNDLIYVDATLRRDQSSTLPEKNNSYFYPSVTTSFIFSNVIDQTWLSFGKIRLNYAEVGNDAPWGRVSDTYRGNAPLNGNPLVTVFGTKLNSNLLPERQKAMEAGLEMNFLNGKAGFDLALYKNNTVDQLMPVRVSQATGYLQKWVNAGEIQNQGIELALFATPVKMSDFKWNINVNWSKNNSEVIELYTDEAGNEVTNLEIASLQGGMAINARVGEPYGTITGSDFTYDDAGNKLVGANGRYVKSATNDEVLGNVNPDWQAGINNTFSYKDFDFGFLIDWSKGGEVFSLDMWYGVGTGLYEETAGLNDLGNPLRDPVTDDNTSGGFIQDGVYAEGTVIDGTDVSGQVNTTRIAGDIFADGWVTSPNKQFVYDASYVKLREVSITYNLPKTLVERSKVLTGASVSFVGSNLWIIHKNLPYADPEASQGAGNIQGWQSGVMPTTRNFGFNIKLQF